MGLQLFSGTVDIFLGFSLAADFIAHAQLSVVPFGIGANVIIKAHSDAIRELGMSGTRQLFQPGFWQNFAQIIADRETISPPAGALQSDFGQNEGKLERKQQISK